MFSLKNCIYLGLIVSTLAMFPPRSAAQTISCRPTVPPYDGRFRLSQAALFARLTFVPSFG